QQDGYQLIQGADAALMPVGENLKQAESGSLAERIAHWMARNDHFANLLGIEVEAAKAGYCRATMVVRSDMLNSVALLHGGATFALADFAFAVASNSHNTVAVGLDAHVSYTAAASLGERLVAVATELKLGKRTALYQVEVRNQHEKLLAHFTGHVFRREDSLSEWMNSQRPPQEKSQ
ncbi:MAG: hotdog fold thioesterase, partial [Gammaproteobacteria bacterium]|nr:hotdog fold thioesterase [Gammaproteobacteria bacterium]